LNGSWHKNDDENISLASYARKEKFKKITNGEYTSQYEKKKNMIKVKCFASHVFWHYAGQSPNMKNGGT